MKFRIAIVLLFVIVLTTACFQSARNRVCVSTSELETYGGFAAVLQSGDKVFVAYKLITPPDLVGLVTEEDKGFLDMFSQLDPVLVTTNIDQMKKENGYTLSQLGDSTNSYAEEHMKVYVKAKNDIWYSIKIPKYC